jgi:hypothetical protein
MTMTMAMNTPDTDTDTVVVPRDRAQQLRASAFKCSKWLTEQGQEKYCSTVMGALSTWAWSSGYTMRIDSVKWVWFVEKDGKRVFE